MAIVAFPVANVEGLRIRKGKKNGEFDTGRLPVLGGLERNRDLGEWRTIALCRQGIVGVDYRGQAVERVDGVLEEVE